MSHLEEIDAVFGGAKNLGGTPKNAILKTYLNIEAK